MTTICGNQLNETGQRLYKIGAGIFVGAIILTGLIITMVKLNDTSSGVFALGVTMMIIGCIFGIYFTISFCCKRGEYTSLPSSILNSGGIV